MDSLSRLIRVLEAPVVQWTELGSSKSSMGVRFPPGALESRESARLAQW